MRPLRSRSGAVVTRNTMNAIAGMTVGTVSEASGSFGYYPHLKAEDCSAAGAPNQLTEISRRRVAGDHRLSVERLSWSCLAAGDRFPAERLS